MCRLDLKYLVGFFLCLETLLMMMVVMMMMVMMMMMMMMMMVMVVRIMMIAMMRKRMTFVFLSWAAIGQWKVFGDVR